MLTLNNIQPNSDDCLGGSEHSIGLVSGANIIIANTRANGARGSEDGEDLNIHAHLIAFNESITIQYWQNSTSDYWGDWNVGNTYKGDGNGLRYGAHTGSDDKRGIIYLWGGFVQLYRGYMKRNSPGPYNVSPGNGMDKAYNWDDNQRCNALPLYPEAENCNEECEINDLPEQVDFDIGEFRVF